MTLQELRTLFIEWSGRLDLINIDGSDNGANVFINAGIRFLDDQQQTPKSTGRRFDKVLSGHIGVTFEDARNIKEVWVQSSTARIKLEKKPMSWLREQYATLTGGLSRGTPLYYAPAVLRPVPDVLTIDEFISYTDYADILLDSHHKYNGVIFMPPADGELIVEVWGDFFTPEMVQDTDENYWSTYYPATLLYAALYRMEVSYRNSEGAKDWLASLERDMIGIDKNLADEEWAGVSQMKG